jgi:hypothetical protein
MDCQTTQNYYRVPVSSNPDYYTVYGLEFVSAADPIDALDKLGKLAHTYQAIDSLISCDLVSQKQKLQQTLRSIGVSVPLLAYALE